MRDIAREYVTARIRARYAEQPAFDTGERDERRARSLLRPHGDVIVVMSCPRAADTAGGSTGTTKEAPMQANIPPGARVRSVLPGCRWVGTVIADDGGNFPYRVAWDHGDREWCSGVELHVLTVADAPAHYAQVAADARYDASLGEGRN